MISPVPQAKATEKQSVWSLEVTVQSNRVTMNVVCLAAAALVIVGACKKDEAETEATSTAKQEKKASPPPPPSKREGREPFRNLVAEAHRAEFEVNGGLWIDFGSADQHKYTRGGWQTGWVPSTDEELSSVGAGQMNGYLDVWLARPCTRLVVRARSKAAGQTLALLVDDKYVGRADFTQENPGWQTLSVVPEQPISAGRHQITLQFAKRAADKVPRAELDWAWFASSNEGAPPAALPRRLPLTIGGQPQRALVAGAPRRYAYYLHVPPEGMLVFDYGAKQATTFAVHVTTEGSEPAQLFSAKAEANAWKEGYADLTPYAGKPIRLELETSGKLGAAGWGEPEIMVPERPEAAETAATAADKPAKNLIFILIDTARADVFAPFAPENEIVTPAHDALSKESTQFVHAYNNENWTKPSVATILTGLYPSTHTAKTDPSVLPDKVTLASQHLQKQGFATAGFIANGFISDKFGFKKGWGTYRNYIRESRKTAAQFVYRDALSWLEARKEGERFFLYIQTIDPHVVYRVGPEYTSHYFEGTYSGPLGPTIEAADQIKLGKGKIKGTERDIAWLKALYHGEVTYHDEHMGKFVDELRQRKLLEDTVLVVTNDHGEELGEHGKYGHGHSLYEELIRAPLIVRYPPIFPPGKQITEVVEQVDLLPTLLETLDVAQIKDVDGQSLLPLLRGEAQSRPFIALTEYLEHSRSFRLGDFKLIRTAGGARLYDLSKDPLETKDIASERALGLRLCEVYMSEALAEPVKSNRHQMRRRQVRYQGVDAKLDPAFRKKLRALGYFGE
jgi:choline-sulfatase